MPLDYAAILGGAQRLVPNLREEAMQDEVMAMRRDQFAMQREQMDYQRQQRQQAMEREAMFRQDMEGVLLRGDPQSIQRMMLRYPEMADTLKPMWEQMDEQQRAADLTQMGSIYSRAQAGDYSGAANVLEQRIAADRAAGVVDEQDEAILAGLRSDNPTEQRAAMATVGWQIAAVNPDKFAETYGKLNPSDSKTGVQKEYEWRVGQFGQSAADRWLATQDTELVTVDAGGSVFNKSDFAGGSSVAPQSGGGDQSAPAPVDNGRQVIESIFPGVRVTQNRRDPKSALGRANPGSWHNRSGGAVDVAPIPGMSFDQFVGGIRAAGYDVIESRDEVANPSSHATGPHWHVVLGEGEGAPQPVRSQQEYARLASGARYRAPDGSIRVKP